MPIFAGVDGANPSASEISKFVKKKMAAVRVDRRR
jgi:hypothetical protein